MYQVLHGHLALLEAARMLRPRAKLIAAYREADSRDHEVFGRTIGPAALFDEAIAPAL
jgi:hypothetical protein